MQYLEVQVVESVGGNKVAGNKMYQRKQRYNIIRYYRRWGKLDCVRV